MTIVGTQLLNWVTSLHEFRPSMPPCLTNLPNEILLDIVTRVDYEDVVSLARTCRALRYLELDDNICRTIVEAEIRCASEVIAARKAGRGYASALRKFVKRRDAVAHANPYSVAMVGLGDEILYCNGVLCYTSHDRIRILELHESARQERVVNIPTLLQRFVFGPETITPGTFRLLHYSHGIVSCLYMLSTPNKEAWLVVFDMRSHEFIAKLPLWGVRSTKKIFVRNDAKYLYFGTYSDNPYNGRRKWILQGFNIKENKWMENKVYLDELIGSDIGSTICFGIFNGYFYALSNQTTYEVEEVDWTSFYHCVRFPVDSPSATGLEKTFNEDMWRRQHVEGPIDDRWTDLRLNVDEHSGRLVVSETRKECLQGRCIGRRTCYTTAVVFRSKETDEYIDTEPPSDCSISKGSSPSASSSSSEGSSVSCLSQSNNSQSTLIHDTSSSYLAPQISQTSASSMVQPQISRPTRFEMASITQDQLALTLTSSDKPHYLPPQTRLPCNEHTESDSPGRSLTISRTPARSYNSSANTFLDLVNDTDGTGAYGVQRLRIRACSRQLKSPLRDNDKILVPESVDPRTGEIMNGLNLRYTSPPATFWPPEQIPGQPPQQQLDDLYKLLNPSMKLGKVEGTMDDRSMVYITGGMGHDKAIIFINFDSSIKLDGLQQWQGSRDVAGLKIHDAGNGFEASKAGSNYGIVLQEADARTACTIDAGKPNDKGKEKEINTSSANPTTTNSLSTSTSKGEEFQEHVCPESSSRWIWIEPAMYKTLGQGFEFGLPKARE